MVIILIVVAAIVLVLPKIMSGSAQSAGTGRDTGDHDIGFCRNCSTGSDTVRNGHAAVSADSCGGSIKDLRDNRGRHLFLR